MKPSLKWLATIVGSIITGVIVYLLTTFLFPAAEPTPEPKPNFPELIVGSYSLESWTDLSQAGLGVQMTEGQLAIAPSRAAVWELMIEKTVTSSSGSLHVLAKGDVIGSSETLEGERDHQCNQIDASDNWGPVDPDLFLAVHGFDRDSKTTVDAFRLQYSEESDGDQVLEMTNGRGSYLWVKKTGPASAAPSILLSSCGISH